MALNWLRAARLGGGAPALPQQTPFFKPGLAAPLSGRLVKRLRGLLLVVAWSFAAIVLGAFALAFVPRLFGWSSFVVYGGSMEPAVPRGSIAVSRPVSALKLEIGDVIAYRPARGRTPTLHRVVGIGDNGGRLAFTLKGDANASADPVPLSFDGPGSEVVYSVPKLGYFIHLTHGTTGRLVFVVLPALWVGAMVLWDIWKPPRHVATSGA